MKLPTLALELRQAVLAPVHQHWRRFGVGHGHAGEGVGEPRPRYDEAGGDLPRGTGISRRHQRGALFMAHGHGPEGIVGVNAVEKRAVVGAHDAEHVLYPFGLQSRCHRVTPPHPGHVAPAKIPPTAGPGRSYLPGRAPEPLTGGVALLC